MNTDPNEKNSEELNESELDSVTGGQGKYGADGSELAEDDIPPSDEGDIPQDHPEDFPEGEERFNPDGTPM